MFSGELYLLIGAIQHNNALFARSCSRPLSNWFRGGACTALLSFDRSNDRVPLRFSCSWPSGGPNPHVCTPSFDAARDCSVLPPYLLACQSTCLARHLLTSLLPRRASNKVTHHKPLLRGHMYPSRCPVRIHPCDLDPGTPSMHLAMCQTCTAFPVPHLSAPLFHVKHTTPMHATCSVMTTSAWIPVVSGVSIRHMCGEVICRKTADN